jgi:hypothetical protein
MEAAKAIREKYADQASKVTTSIRMNQVITDVPDTVANGAPIKTVHGHLVGRRRHGPRRARGGRPDRHHRLRHRRKLFVEQDQAAGMQAFMAGKIKVQGDMMKMMAMQTSMPQDDIAKTIAKEIKDITA